MELKLVILVCLVVIAWLSTGTDCKSVPNQYFDESDVEFVNPGQTDQQPGGYPSYPGFGGGGRGIGGGVSKIFQDWMKFIQGFFQEGNWNNGGPQNIASFIGNQVSKLIGILTRDVTDENYPAGSFKQVGKK